MNQMISNNPPTAGAAPGHWEGPGSRSKRALDVFLTLTLLLPVLCVVACTALLVRVGLGSPVLFLHRRAGYLGKPFMIFKFRTMTNDCDDEGRLLPDAQRLTRLGRWLRALSLDELPQLLNVLMGDMSLVGPRPLLVEYLPRYSPHQARRHEIPPGITGWAQVNGRNAQSWEQRLRLDVQYVEQRSLVFDLKILAMTVSKVLFREGINAGPQAPMEEFKGDER